MSVPSNTKGLTLNHQTTLERNAYDDALDVFLAEARRRGFVDYDDRFNPEGRAFDSLYALDTHPRVRRFEER